MHSSSLKKNATRKRFKKGQTGGWLSWLGTVGVGQNQEKDQEIEELVSTSAPVNDGKKKKKKTLADNRRDQIKV